MKTKILGTRVPIETYDLVCSIGNPSDVLRSLIDEFLSKRNEQPSLSSPVNVSKDRVNDDCFNCRYQRLCTVIDEALGVSIHE